MITIALTGNPNSGKTSIFNVLTGAHQKVGNWGGVTVEVKEGVTRRTGKEAAVVDLPGTYSLSAYSLEERVARDYIVEQRPEVVVDIVDASNLERNLYLAVQLQELGVRPVLAFNMWDEVERKGISVDTERLSRLMGVPVVTTVGRTGQGVDALLEEAFRSASSARPLSVLDIPGHFPSEVEQAIETLSAHEAVRTAGKYPPRWAAVKLFENDPRVMDIVRGLPGGEDVLAEVQKASEQIRARLGEEPQTLIAEARYGRIAGALRETVQYRKPDRVEISDRIDTFLTHRFLAYPVFLVFMWVLFQTTFTLGRHPMNWIEGLFRWLSVGVSAALPPGVPRDLLVDGVIEGVGGVAVFLPNILILFLGVSIMEDTGYMARAAFIMDKIMHKMGLHGKSFIPLLMGLGCNVPAIMATRTLESERDRIKTILLAPLISCSARLPIYVLLAGALFPRHAGNVVFLFQFVFGTVAFFLMGMLLTRTLFRGEDYPFVMELPPYRLPTFRSVLLHMWEKAKHFVKKMGGVVLCFSVVLWVLSSYPRPPELVRHYAQLQTRIENREHWSARERNEVLRQLRREKRLKLMEASYIAGIGRALEPLVKPLGFDWRDAVSLAAGFVAKEVVVSSFGVLFAADEDSDEHSEELRARMAEHYTPLTAFAFMCFVLLYTPCMVALVTMIRELRNWKWSVFALFYQVGLAWIVAFAVYQGGRLVGLE